MNKTVRSLEFVAFHKSVWVSNKEKISVISGVKDNLGFLCFDWFELNKNSGLKISLEISTNFLLLLQAYLLYTNV